MIGTIRKHQNWLWTVIIAAIIVSFVVYFSPDASWRSAGGGSSTFGSIKGRPISREEYATAYRETQMRYLFSYGQWPTRDARNMGFDIDRETYNRVFLIEKLKELKLEAGEDAAAQWIADNFKDRTQKIFRKESYDKFIEQSLRPQGISEEQLLGFVKHEVAIAHLIQLTGLNGKFAPAKDIESLYRIENQPIQTEVVSFNYSNYLAGIKVTPDALAQYYTNRQAMYRIPDRVIVSYVRFPSTNYVGEVDAMLSKDTNLSLKIESYYQRKGPETFKDPAGTVLTAEAAKAKLREDMRQEYLLLSARKAAAVFAQELMEAVEKGPKTPDQLTKLANAKNLSVAATEPFSASEPPAGLKVLESFVRNAFVLTQEEPFAAEPIVGEDGVYVIALNQRLPSSIPSLASIKEKLTEDFKQSRALEEARLAGVVFATSATNTMASGKNFAAACQASKVVPVKMPVFSRATRTLPEADSLGGLSELKNAAFALQAGQVSGFVATQSGGFVVFLSSRPPVDETKMKTEFKEFATSLQNSRQFEAFSEWFRYERELAHIVPSSTGKQ